MKKAILILFLVGFGLPFLLITDLFPLHRFGMFARVATVEVNPASYSIGFKMKDKPWQKLETGNAYFDQNYFPMWAEKAFSDSGKANQLTAHLLETMPVDADSMRIVQYGKSDSLIKPIYPKP